jgi:Flp pilus assembly protein TadB
MTEIVALGFVTSAGLLVAALRLREDPRIRGSLRLLELSVPSSTGWDVVRQGSRPRRVSVAAVGRRLALPRARRLLTGRLRDAGRSPSEVDRWLGWKALLGLAGVLAGFPGLAGGGPAAVATAAVLALAAYRLPDFLLGRLARSLRETMEARLPELLDLVALSVGAGLTPRLALDRVAELGEGRLAEQLGAARRDVSLGTPWRIALRRLAERTGLRDLRRLAVTLERSERLGAPVGEQLRNLAREVRAERRAAAEERARRAPVLMLFPLVFLILPAFVLAAVVPALLVATRGIP